MNKEIEDQTEITSEEREEQVDYIEKNSGLT